MFQFFLIVYSDRLWFGVIADPNTDCLVTCKHLFFLILSMGERDKKKTSE